MLRLLYCSQSRADITQKSLEEILLVSRKNNKALEITGVLVHGGGLYMQVLEGPEKAVLRSYTKILDDKRHTDCRIIHIAPAKDRLFGNWSMGVLEADPLTFEQVAKLRAHRLESVNSEAFSDVMREFQDMLIKE